MRVQTYARWVHHPTPPPNAGTARQAVDDLTGFIDDLIAGMAYYPSVRVEITSDADGLLVAGAQRVIQADEQPDGMVVLQTRGDSMRITHAAYQRLLA